MRAYLPRIDALLGFLWGLAGLAEPKCAASTCF
jgi:hypothetical protein